MLCWARRRYTYNTEIDSQDTATHVPTEDCDGSFSSIIVEKVSKLILTRVLLYAFASRKHGAIDNQQVDIIQKETTKQCTMLSKKAYKKTRFNYSLALVWAFFSTGSSLVAFMTLPLILSLPPMKRRWALALPATSLPKFSSERTRVTRKEGR